MATRKYKPVTNGLRQRSTVQHESLTKVRPHKPLLKRLSKTGGRNNSGKLTVRHRGGGAKKLFRLIDFDRLDSAGPSRVLSIEYDPYRTACIALVVSQNGRKYYIIAPNKLQVGDTIDNGAGVEVRIGNSMPLASVPTGSQIHNIELQISGGAKLVRSAGTYATLLAKQGSYATIKLPSGETRLIHCKCKATIGQVGNLDNRNQVIGKAGANRWRGFRPTVRGAAMNPCDHPHGGGEGKAPVGASAPRSKWGKIALGKKTRKNKTSNKFIVRRKKGR